MATIISLRGKTPKIGQDCFIAETSAIIGDVEIGNNCSIWFNTVIRGDVHSIRIGNNVNIQDGAVLHGTYKKASVDIGNNVSIAHNAIVHGCTIKDNVLIGMGAIIMDNAIIGSNCIIAAGSLIKSGTIVEANSVYAGTPAKKIKTISSELSTGEIQRISNSYEMYASWYKPNKLTT